jgi:hypothetical protein
MSASAIAVLYAFQSVGRLCVELDHQTQTSCLLRIALVADAIAGKGPSTFRAARVRTNKKTLFSSTRGQYVKRATF